MAKRLCGLYYKHIMIVNDASRVIIWQLAKAIMNCHICLCANKHE